MPLPRTLAQVLRPMALASTLILGALSTGAQAYTEGYLNPSQGWKLLQPDFDASSPLDAISLEWDYWMVHSDTWNGIVAYLLANPRGKAPYLDWALLPNGNNVAAVGELPGQRPVANYQNFGYDNSSIRADVRAMKTRADNGHYADYSWTRLPNGEPAALLKGRTQDWEWDFTVTQDQLARDRLRALTGAFTTSYGRDVGVVAGAEWNVDEAWPRTRVVGTVIERSTGRVIPVQGQGYRENGWGKYGIPFDGWDFMVFGETDPQGVVGSFQTYHRSDKMDAFDVSFYDGDTPVAARFHAWKGEMGWTHPAWTWDKEAHSCVPLNTRIVAKNAAYLIEVKVDIGTHQRALMTSQTLGSSIMFIQEHFPTVSGTIKRLDGTVVRTFSARGGGEFARTKDALPWRSDMSCTLWGWVNHARPFPK